LFRVLYLAHAFHVGGAEEMAFTLARRLPRRFASSVCCITSSGPMGDEMRRAGIGVEVLGLMPGLKRPQDVWALRSHLARIKPHIVHTFLITASLYGRAAAILARVPVVIGTEVNVYARKAASHIVAERLLLRGTDCVIASAEAVRDFYVDQVHADRDRVKVIYNAVDWAAIEPSQSRAAWRASIGLPATADVVTIIARLTEQKAHCVLFEALASTPALHATHLLVVGDGELGDALRRRADELGISARTHFVGARRDLGNVLAASDVFVMPSLWEGLPLSLVLAMGAGLPVVATRVAGIPEVVEHGTRGLLVEPGDSAALGAALAHLVSDPDRRRHLGCAAREFVLPRFGADTYVSAVASLYDSLLAAKGIH
jgi:glycosyltransferase involved in cell wall biosynthesis